MLDALSARGIARRRLVVTSSHLVWRYAPEKLKRRVAVIQTTLVWSPKLLRLTVMTVRRSRWNELGWLTSCLLVKQYRQSFGHPVTDERIGHLAGVGEAPHGYVRRQSSSFMSSPLLRSIQLHQLGPFWCTQAALEYRLGAGRDAWSPQRLEIGCDFRDRQVNPAGPSAETCSTPS